MNPTRSWLLLASYFLLPLPKNRYQRLNLLVHELFHVSQADLGFYAHSPSNEHLNNALIFRAYQQQLFRQHTGLFIGFIKRLNQAKFLLAFLVFSVVLIMLLGILSYIIFWSTVALGTI